MTSTFREFDEVRFVQDTPPERNPKMSGFRTHAYKGETGVIVHEHQPPGVAFVVEVFSAGKTVALVDAVPEELELIATYEPPNEPRA